MSLLDMAAREEDPDYHGPPSEVDPLSRPPNHRGGSTVEAQPSAAGPSASAANEGKPIEKTISCVSCRKRKLKCDRIKPKCGTCTRLRHDCEYPERRRNLGSKRRNMKELEARLAQVETQLVSEQIKANTTQGAKSTSMDADWNDLTMDMNIDMGDDGLLDDTFDLNSAGFGFQPLDPTIPMGDFFSHELLELGLQEPLPPQEMMDDLHQIYFEKFHPQVPMMHKYRYYTSLSKSPNFRPPVCLRYAMWAVAASLSDKYRCYEDLLYERARRYIQDAEMKGHGESFVSVYHAQTWGLISNFEAKKTYFSRSWMSTGRMVRLTQMLGLYRLDISNSEFKQILPPARDWIELEERRRTFWAAYYGDRWASSGTGWPMLIDESEIQTNLPSSEEAFEQGIMQPTISLAEALTPDGARSLSPFAGVILSATLFGHNFQHLHKSGPDEHPEDLGNGEFWKRHRKMDNVLSNTFMFLPDHLRLPAGARNMNVVFIHMNIHASAICLHQAAILTAEKHSLDQAFIQQSRARCLLAAEEIANIMRLICHVDPITMHPWIGFCLYVSAGVYVKDYKRGTRDPNCMTTLEFLLSAMRSIGAKHNITNHFTAQVELDMQAAGIVQPSQRPSVECVNTTESPENPDIPSLPINGLLPDRHGLPMTYANLQAFVRNTNIHPVAAGVLLRDYSSSSPNSGESPNVPSEPSSNRDTGMKSVLDMNKESSHLDTLTPNTSSNTLFDQTGLSSFAGGASILSGKTQSNQPSSGNTMQYPIRSSTPNNQQNSNPPGFPWSATGKIVGVGLENLIPLGMPNSSTGWPLPDGKQHPEKQHLPTSYPEGGDNSAICCPFADQQKDS
ncbi:hypothetical protein EG329_005206 [Mollisiaceae sp. DMI_Dod_QoI]|nr:hypothetical protein EG329_005206 [Helotiales sp. DMI_Dod_QoI]